MPDLLDGEVQRRAAPYSNNRRYIICPTSGLLELVPRYLFPSCLFDTSHLYHHHYKQNTLTKITFTLSSMDRHHVLLC